jgi:hypothetical protein
VPPYPGVTQAYSAPPPGSAFAPMMTGQAQPPAPMKSGTPFVIALAVLLMLGLVTTLAMAVAMLLR